MVLNFPPEKKNERFFKDLFANKRPALSFVGFDNGGDHAYGYGLKQVVELAHVANSIQNHTIRRLLDLSNRRLLKRGEKAPGNDLQAESGENKESSRRHLVNNNSRIFQSKVFIALLTLVLEENQLSLPGISLPSHEETMTRIITLIQNHKGDDDRPFFANEIAPLISIDRVKWTTSLGNMSRALDLYLAIENAYAFYGRDEGRLLDRKKKGQFLKRFYNAIEGILGVVDSGIGKKISGNWSLKMWVAAGYACMAMQQRDDLEIAQLVEWFGRALRRAGPDLSGNRRRYWSFMTSKKINGRLVDGQRMWAEGPYYLQFTVQEMIPFWHAVRAQGYLRVPDIELLRVDFSDPFHSSWFINPLEWMADIATPEGETPPFDDGNRHPIYSANVMNWSHVYGFGKLGEKMNWVYRKVSRARRGIPSKWKKLNNEILLVDLSIPKAEKATEPSPVIGNFSMFDRSESQLIVRRKIDGRTHYICMHGEGQLSSIERGEGHEQPDQLQLLYYIDKQSMLMDAGYDHGSLVKNSSWNRYCDHNVMAYVEDDGGLSAPRLDKTVTHNPVDHLYFDSRSNDALSIMKGRIRLKYRRGSKLLGHRDKSDSQYDRTVLFVADRKGPYLVDVNQVYTDKSKGSLPTLRMRYHVDSNRYLNGQKTKWNTWQDIEQGRLDFYAHLGAVEHKKDTDQVSIEDKEVRERFSKKNHRNIKRLSFTGKKEVSFATVAVFNAGTNPPVDAPEPLIAYKERTALTHQVWKWDNKVAGTIDFIFARSYADLKAFDQEIAFDVEVGDERRLLICPASQGVGFIRYEKQNNIWQVIPEYLYGLTEGAPHLIA